MTKIKFQILFLSLLSSFFLCLAWAPEENSYIMFFALVPLLIIENIIASNKLSKIYYFASIYIAYLLWHIYSTSWLYDTSITSTLIIQLINPIILTLPWVIFTTVKKNTNKVLSYLLLVSTYISVEYFHFNWDLKFPLFTLGNGFATNPQWIQFYEYTGVLGGSFWVLISNITVFHSFSNVIKSRWSKSSAQSFATMLIIIFAPLIFSTYTFNHYEERGTPIETLVVHPNIDCRTEKYDWDLDRITSRYIDLTLEKIDSTTDYIIWPETAIPDIGWMSNLSKNVTLKKISNDLTGYENANLITGAIAYEQYTGSRSEPDWIKQNFLRFHEESNVWYKTYNSAIQFDINSGKIHLRSKKELVPVEETIPFNGTFSFLRSAFPSLGGFLFSTRKHNTNVFPSESGHNVTTLICYESLFGELTAQYVRDGANLIFIILNEGWYKNIKGASQFMHFSRIRAIENRRAIARSSNDGISCFINQRGELIDEYSDFKSFSFKASLISNKRKTFYTMYGDYLGSIFVMISVIIFIVLFYMIYVK